MTDSSLDQDIESYLQGATPEEIQFFKKALRDKNPSMIQDLKSSIYRVTPPTPMQFLDEWIHPKTRSGLFPFVIETFCKIWDFEKGYTEVVLYGSTRSSKSLISRFCIIYIIVLLWCMKEPQEYLGISKMSSIAIFLLCFSKRKTKNILLDPIFKELSHSPKFKRVKKLENVDIEQEKLGTSRIVWTTASVGDAEVEFSNSIQIHVGSNPMDIIGADIVASIISEINFFIENAGISEDDVWKMYNETKDRIQGTVGKKYGSLVILDSSANNRDSIIETYALEEAPKDPNVCFLNIPRWEARPHLFPNWQKDGTTFDVFVGTMGRAPRIIDESFHKKAGDEAYIIKVPIDALPFFRKKIDTALKNIAGVPVNNTALFFPDLEIVKKMFDPYLRNVDGPVTAPLSGSPKGLIMNQVRHILFEQDIKGRWVLRRAKNAQRVLRIDLSESKDSTGVALGHAEICDNGQAIVVTDIAFDIVPDKKIIYLEAILSFILELVEYGVKLAMVSTDRYQSSFIKQGLMKKEIPYKLISMDDSKTPYQVFRSKVESETFKVGYYLNLLNNVKSLIETNKKIDHTSNSKARTKGNSQDKLIGIHSKDIADATAGMTFNMLELMSSFSITDNYDDITRKLAHSREIKSGIELSGFDREKNYQSLIKNIQKDRGKIFLR